MAMRQNALALAIIAASPITVPGTTADDQPDVSVTAVNNFATGNAQQQAIANTSANYSSPEVHAQLAEHGLTVADVRGCKFAVNVYHTQICVDPIDGETSFFPGYGTTMIFSVNSSGPPGQPLYADAPQQIVVSWSDVASLPIESGEVTLQNTSGSHYLSVPMPAWSTATTHTLTMTLLGSPIEIRLTPIEWAWDFGQETVPNQTTRTGGQPYPDLTIAPEYQDVADDVTITTTITWEGEYRVAGTETWFPVLGRGTTTATSTPFDVNEYRTYLIPHPDYDGPAPGQDQ